MNSFKKKITSSTWRLVFALLAGFVLVSCGGSGGSAPPATTVISGVVTDDPIADSTITAQSIVSNIVLGTAKTATDGSYSMIVPTADIGTGYTLSSSGGTMNGQVFTGSLSAIIPATANSQQSNLTLITSALAQAANTTTQFSGTTLQKQQAIIADAIARGLIDPNYASTSGAQVIAAQNQAQQLGPTPVVNQLVQLLAFRSKPSDCGIVVAQSPTVDTTCQDVKNGDILSLSLNGADVKASAGDIKNCRAVETFDSTAQVMTMHLENIPFDPTNLTTTYSACQVAGDVTLTLPPSIDPAPDECANNLATGITHCVTTVSGITPGYFIENNDGDPHRAADNITQTITPTIGWPGVKFSRSFGAVLSVSTPLMAGPGPITQWPGKNAVIFVHGFQPFDGFGGDDGTWGELTKFVADDPSFVAFNFQWKTDASYLTVAGELAKAVDYAYSNTGNNKVHIVAHSFGGVLSRTMLQNLNGATAVSAAKVATLTTIGTPHSGISNVKGGITVSDEGGTQTLPEGWGAGILPATGGILPDILGCKQITCYQAGLDPKISPWAINQLVPDSGAGTNPNPGYISARLANFVKYPFPTGLKVRVLIGQVFDSNAASMNSDYLISYYGQRFKPDAGNSALLVDQSEGGATVTERILGLPISVNAVPGISVDKNSISTYMYGSPFSIGGIGGYFGYRHASWLGVGPDKYEVNVPANCGNADTCQHDTWVNIKKLWNDNGYCVAPLVLQNGQCVVGGLAKLWTWISGSNSGNAVGVYGTKGVAAATNIPGARAGAMSGKDSLGNLWLFGGTGYDSVGTSGYLNDLWKFDGSNWIWVSGSNTVSAVGVYGTKGLATATNVPSARTSAVSWIDSSGNFWLFGGFNYWAGYLNDLWKFDGTNWTWISGSNTGDAVGVYGTKGVASPINFPGVKNSAIGWTDDNNNLWLFGGEGYDSFGYIRNLNDLWKFDGTNWTWVSGSSSGDAVGVYGTKGVATTTNIPGARAAAMSGKDSLGNLWLFGGSGYDSVGTSGYLNDLWKFDGTNWTWVSGSSTANAVGVYGTKGGAAVTNVPNSTYSAVSWTDSFGNFRMFGGRGYDSNGVIVTFNVLWHYQQ